jgi:hypothetical protein
MNAMTTEATGETGEAEGGPMWGRFFDSIGGGDDTASEVSGSHMPSLGDFPSQRSMLSLSQVQQSPFSEVHPNDSASVVDEEGSVLDGYPRKKSGEVPTLSGIESSMPVDDGTYVFKFRTPSGRTHRFQARNDNLENLRDIISGKLASDPHFAEWRTPYEDAPRPDPLDFTLSYTDADGDAVLMTSDADVSDAVKIARAAGADRVVLFVQGGKGWDEVEKKSEAKAAEVAAAVREEVKEVEKSEATLPEGVHFTAPAHAHIPPPAPAPELVMGIPKDLVLPASIGALAVAIIGVFAISRMSSR